MLEILRDRGSISQEEYESLLNPGGADRGPDPSIPTRPATEGSPSQDPPAALDGVEQRVEETERSLESLDQRLKEAARRLFDLEEITDGTSSDLIEKALADKWYERLEIGGYTQFRFTSLLDDAGSLLNVPNDRSVSETESFIIRRGRFKLSGDVTEHLYLYSQLDYAGSVGGTGDLGLQARDLYADVTIDDSREFRIRVGQSKVPFGWVNMQSSQNRAPLERPDAINSAAEGERDFGVYLMYAPVEVRKRFKELVKTGLKGSGDYGMLTFGAFGGQGLNRPDLDGEVHWLARAAYPFQLECGQLFELGVQAYSGRFVPSVQPVTVGAATTTPTFHSKGVLDERVGVTAVWYPQPFGLEMEWNVGRGPQLNSTFTRIDDAWLHGGYVTANYRLPTEWGTLFPFVRWQYYEGGRKFGRNAPASDVNEADVGFEWSPWLELEFAIMYTHSFERTNSRNFPYRTVEDADRIGFQLQWNY